MSLLMLFPASLILLLVFPLLIAHFYEGNEFNFLFQFFHFHFFKFFRIKVRTPIEFAKRMETNEIRNKTKFIQRTSDDDVFCLDQGSAVSKRRLNEAGPIKLHFSSQCIPGSMKQKCFLQIIY